MSKTIKTILFTLISVAVLAALIYFKSCSNTPAEETQTESATVLLDRIEKVAKLITVEGYFSEVYKYKDYYKYDVSFLRKQALLRIKAKVSVGYDLSNMDITVDESNKKIIIAFPDSVQILSIDHDLDYYDLSEGTFNSFDEDDYNKLEESAKDFIRQKALDSDLMSNAEGQLTDMIDIISALVAGSEYTLEVISLTRDQSEAPVLSK